MTTPEKLKADSPGPRKTASQTLVRNLAANEFVFAVVGPVGSGTSEIADVLKGQLSTKGYRAEILKARTVITAWADHYGPVIPAAPLMAQTTALQNAGDDMRERTGTMPP